MMQHYHWRHTTWLMLAFALGVWLVMSLSACAPGGTGTVPQSTATGTASQGIVKGVVMAGPTCPIEKYPPDPRCSSRPVPDQKVLFKTPGGVLVTQVTTDKKGKFTVTLPPGTYDLQVPGARLYQVPQQHLQVTVVAGQTVQIQIMLDTGIR